MVYEICTCATLFRASNGIKFILIIKRNAGIKRILQVKESVVRVKVIKAEKFPHEEHCAKLNRQITLATETSATLIGFLLPEIFQLRSSVFIF